MEQLCQHYEYKGRTFNTPLGYTLEQWRSIHNVLDFLMPSEYSYPVRAIAMPVSLTASAESRKDAALDVRRFA